MLNNSFNNLVANKDHPADWDGVRKNYDVITSNSDLAHFSVIIAKGK
jgi:hypothetical protein